LTLVTSQMTTMFRFVVGVISSGTATKGRIIEFDDASGTGTRTEGILRKQAPTSFSPAIITGNYVFGWLGVNSPVNARSAREWLTQDRACSKVVRWIQTTRAPPLM
jgi:hypothetical protein